MRPPEVLDHQAAVIDFLQSRNYHAYLDRFLADMKRKSKLSGSMSGAEYAHILQVSLSVAQAFYVMADMLPLVRAGAMDLDDDDHLIHELLPAESGFLVLEEGWVMRDVWGTQSTTNAFAWRHGTAPINGRPTPGIWLTSFTDTNDVRDEGTQALIRDLGEEAIRSLGRFHVNHITFYAYRTPVGPTAVLTPEQYARFAQTGQGLEESVENPARMYVAIFRLLSQVIVEVADAKVDRATTRRMAKKNLPTRVQTIKLRRKQRIYDRDEHGAESHIDWQHQWVVRGHWAWRACGETHLNAEPYEKGFRTRVYIAPYFKGPDDKPIHITEKVWGLSQ